MASGRLLLVFLVLMAGVTTVSGVFISDFNGVTDVLEGSTTNTYCNIYLFIPGSSITWNLTTKSNLTLHLGSCDIDYHFVCKRCQSSYSDIQTDICSYRSSVNVMNISRQRGGQLSCSVTRNNNKESDTTLLNVYQLPLLDNCNVDIMRHNWSAVLSCDVSRAFSTADIYTLRVQEAYLIHFNSGCIDSQARQCLMATDNPGRSKQATCTRHDDVSLRQWLTPYINSTDSKEYYRGRLVYSWKLSSFSAQKWMVKIYACTGARVVTCNHLQRNMSRSDTLRSLPSRPKHNCTDISYIAEDGEHVCLCTTADLGTPRGRLVWKRGPDVLATGGYNAKQLSLPRLTRRREEGSHRLECQLDWIEPGYAMPRLNVAYGPDSVDILAYQDVDTNDTLLIVIKCRVTGLNPKTPDMVQWGGPCQGQTGFTCIVDPLENVCVVSLLKGDRNCSRLLQSVDTEVQGLNVTCRVTNAANDGHSVMAVKAIKTACTMSCAEKRVDSGSSDGKKWAVIGGAVTLGMVVVIAVLMLLFVMYRRGFPCSGQLDGSTNPPTTQQSAEVHMYEVLRTDGANVGATSSNRDNTTSNNSSKKNNTIGNNSNKNKGRGLPQVPKAEHVYENTSFSEQGAHI